MFNVFTAERRAVSGLRVEVLGVVHDRQGSVGMIAQTGALSIVAREAFATQVLPQHSTSIFTII